VLFGEHREFTARSSDLGNTSGTKLGLGLGIGVGIGGSPDQYVRRLCLLLLDELVEVIIVVGAELDASTARFRPRDNG
jgi:hypothetical protein